jgi:hypothetical protein
MGRFEQHIGIQVCPVGPHDRAGLTVFETRAKNAGSWSAPKTPAPSPIQEVRSTIPWEPSVKVKSTMR